MSTNQNLSAFLTAIRFGEGTSGENGYTILCGGQQFESFESHPALKGWKGFALKTSMCEAAGFNEGCVSTAAGAYQINKPTWQALQAVIGKGDFSPERQDAAAIELIREKGALEDVFSGHVRKAVEKCRKVWASLPGAGYSQHEVALSTFNEKYAAAGGVIS